MSMGQILKGLRLLLPVVITTHIAFFLMDGMAAGSVELSESEAARTDEAFAEATRSMMSFMSELLLLAGGVLAIQIGAVIFLSALGAIAERKVDPLTRFGTRRRTRTKPVDETDRRCVNCHGEITDGVRNIASKEQVLFGVRVREHERVETFECGECAEADWFDHAMRAGEHEDELFKLNEPEESGTGDAKSGGVE